MNLSVNCSVFLGVSEKGNAVVILEFDNGKRVYGKEIYNFKRMFPHDKYNEIKKLIRRTDFLFSRKQKQMSNENTK